MDPKLLEQNVESLRGVTSFYSLFRLSCVIGRLLICDDLYLRED